MAPTLLQDICVAENASILQHFSSFPYCLVKVGSAGEKVGFSDSATLNILTQPPVPILIDLLAKFMIESM